MKIKYKTWLFFALFCTALLSLSTGLLLHFVFDIDCVFRHTIINNNQVQGNFRFSKIVYLDKNYSFFNSYIIGGSRIGIINPDSVDKYITQSKFYNLCYGLNSPHESLLTIDYIISHYNVKNIILQVSLFDMLPKPESIPPLHYHVSGKSRIHFYFNYIFKNDILSIIDYYHHKNNLTNYFLKPTLSKGSYDCTFTESLILKNENVYFSDDQFSSKYPKFTQSIKSVNLDDLERIKKKCIENNVKLITVFIPESYLFLNQFDTDSYCNFLKDLSQIVNFWNFSGYNTITTDIKNYYDLYHFRYHIGNLMLAKIFNDTNKTIPSDFGFYVTKDNIQQHINDLKIKIK